LRWIEYIVNRIKGKKRKYSRAKRSKKKRKEEKNKITDSHKLTGIVVDLCIKIHSKIGPGYFERVYEEL
jgi:hypothetical protein